jgi:redox-sensitive bicupin YhaK (pirin superfamily)
LKASDTLGHDIAKGRGLWLQVIRGELAVHGETLRDGDAAHAESEGPFTIVAAADSEALLFDLG